MDKAINKIEINTNVYTKQRWPSSGKFWLIPVFSPHLRVFIEGLSWNCVDKTLRIDIKENPYGTAYKWFSGINNRYADSQKSPFVDLEKDSVVLVVLDDEEEELFRYKFRNLSLTDHNCDWINFPQDHLHHKIVIKYQTVEEVDLRNAEPLSKIKAGADDPYQIIDEEWRVEKDYKTADPSSPETIATENT